MTPARKLLTKTARDCERFREPDTDKAEALLNKLFEVAGLPTIRHEAITSIHLGETKVTVETSYSVMSCDRTSHYELPVEIVDAPDPVRAAQHYRATTLLRTLSEERGRIEHNLATLNARLPEVVLAIAEAEQALAKFDHAKAL